MALKMVTK